MKCLSCNSTLIKKKNKQKKKWLVCKITVFLEFQPQLKSSRELVRMQPCNWGLTGRPRRRAACRSTPVSPIDKGARHNCWVAQEIYIQSDPFTTRRHTHWHKSTIFTPDKKTLLHSNQVKRRRKLFALKSKSQELASASVFHA